MKSIVFDAGPVISLTTNNLLWLLDSLKNEFNGDFIIPRAVRGELVDKPLQSKRFKFEALQVMFRINKGVFNVVEMPKVKVLADELLELANHTFKTRGNWLRIVHYAEMEVLATAIVMNSSAVVIDERTSKLLVEDPKELIKVLNGKLGSKVFVNKPNLDKIRGWTRNLRVIRSVELVLVGYEKGLLDKYLPDDKQARQTLVDSLLWGVKLHGCAISKGEIRELVELETQQRQ